MTHPISFRRGVIGSAITGELMFQLLLSTALAGRISLPGCPDSCGDIQVPYPFGVGRRCSHDGFDLTCNETHHQHKLFLGDGGLDVEVLGISLPDGTVRIQTDVLRSNASELNVTWSVPNATGPLKVSSSRNSFVAFGCNVVAQLIPHSEPLSSASICAAVCPRRSPARRAPAWRVASRPPIPSPGTSLRMALKLNVWPGRRITRLGLSEQRS
ncbi:hypothetical protein HU200_057816 [Digitaria exilis]|uniref:Wall-associated receptor kinase galacturonan-binding domain-containing protein n=1 Tax=Digitaria exilis TaxID=1010633 RepID=A0A835E2G0_9POAL|nr:hypothetical protein HU200_057816 [Digitaria exilis]